MGSSNVLNLDKFLHPTLSSLLHPTGPHAWICHRSASCVISIHLFSLAQHLGMSLEHTETDRPKGR